jgi:tRNA G46 methylase TrmB
VIHERFLDDIRLYLSDTARIHISTDVGELHAEMHETIQTVPWLSLVAQDPFWETQYASHWQQFSEETGRKTWCMTAQVVT